MAVLTSESIEPPVGGEYELLRRCRPPVAPACQGCTRQLPQASGGAALILGGKTVIRLAYYGCTNRPFFHIVVSNVYTDRNSKPIEQLGTFDPMPNKDNQKLVSVNLERIQHWIGTGSICSRPVSELLGLMGFFPLHPRTYQNAWKNRQKAAAEAAKHVSAATTEASSKSE